MARKHQDYDWLNDPFDEKKAAAEREAAKMSAGARVGLGCGCAVVVCAIVVLFIFSAVQFAAIAAF